MHTFTLKDVVQHPALSQAIHSKSSALTHFQIEGLEFIKSILNAKFQDGFAKAKFHENMIQNLRDLIVQKNNLSKPYDPLTQELIGFIDDLSVWMFTQPDLRIPVEQFMVKATGYNPDRLREVYQKDPTNYLNNIHTHLQTLARFTSYEKTGGILNDPILFGDVPSYLFNLSNPKKTRVMRMSNMARDLSLNPSTQKTETAKVNEEFLNYLMARLDKKHLYVNLMARDGEEIAKSQEIENLEKKSELLSAIVVVSLDKGKTSHFYYQTGPYKQLSSAKNFKAVFLERLFEPKGVYYWSMRLDMPAWKKQVEEMMEKVHSDYFGSRAHLTAEERQDFIELLYLKIIDALVVQFEPDILTISCKQTVDRGPSIYTLVYVYDQLKAQNQLDKMKMFTLFFSPPLALHNRLGHDYRVTRLQSAANKLMQAAEAK